jgi:hypothetical protein
MLDIHGRLVSACSAALVLSLVGSSSALADPRSGRSTPPGQDTTASTGTTSSTTDTQTGTGTPSTSGGNSSWAGGDGQLETSIPLKDAWSLQMGITVDPEQQSRSNGGTSDINGRVGLGFRF